EGLRRGAAYLAKPAGARNPSMSEFLRVGTGVLCRSRGKIDRGGGDRGGRLREARLRESSTGGRSLWLAGGRWLPPPTPPRHEGDDTNRQHAPESLAPRGSPARGRRAESAGPPRGAPRGCRAG